MKTEIEPGGWTPGHYRIFNGFVAEGMLLWIGSRQDVLGWWQSLILATLSVTSFLDLSLRLRAAILGGITLLSLYWSVPAQPTLYAAMLFVPGGRVWLWICRLVALVAAVYLNWSLHALWSIYVFLVWIEPGWIAPRRARQQPEMVFYDGHCGLCHAVVRFLLAEDPGGTQFRFAPLDSDKFRNTVPEPVRTKLPDSVVIWTEDGAALSKWAAVLYMMDQLGGYWRVFGFLSRAVPGSMGDYMYDWIARIRHRLFKPPADSCPLVPKELRARFD